MSDLVAKIEKIVTEFIHKNVPENKTEDFILAAIHFNININVCSKYDLMRIDHKAKELINLNSNKLLTKSAIFSYILFREINNGNITGEDLVKVKVFLMNISTAITDFMTYRINEQDLNLHLLDQLKSIGI